MFLCGNAIETCHIVGKKNKYCLILDNIMLLHYSELSSVRVLVEQGKEIIVKESGVNPQALNSLQREFSVIRDMQSRGLDYGLLTKHDNILTDSNNTLRFTRKGTHDLSDVGHDLKIAEFAEIITNLVCEIDSIHKTGYVHRDIKPGNVMVTQNSKGAKAYAGIVDFGMALKINRKQDEVGVAGGTKPFCHRVQFEPLERAHPGLDWYSLALTSLYLMRSDVTSIEAELAANPDGIIVDLNSIFGNNNGTISTFNPFSTGSSGMIAEFCMELQKLIQFATSSNCTLDGLSEIAVQLVKISREFLRRKDWRRIPNGGQNLPLYGSNLVRHDILLIVDETNSLASQMDKIKQTLDDVVAEFDGAMDLRVDLWAVRDYSRTDNGAVAEDTVRKVAYRLTPRAMAFAIDEIAANAPQHDEAEAYEMAFEEALGYDHIIDRPSLWLPRGNTTRTVILAGDAYAHGWLRKNWWAPWHGEAKEEGKENTRKNSFKKLHPGVFQNNMEERNAYQERRKLESQKTDQFGSRNQKVPGRKGKEQHRPNLRKVVERLRDKKKCTIHTIFLGADIVAKSYMKFVACLGNGVFIEAGSDFGDALVGVFASPDKQLYDKLVNQGNTSDSAKKNLAPLTTFVLDV